jgi:uncharacterized protein YbjT (DUF2867 family)
MAGLHSVDASAHDGDAFGGDRAGVYDTGAWRRCMNEPSPMEPIMNTSSPHPSAPRTLAVLGGTRGTGRAIVEQALAGGHAVRLLARSGTDLVHPRLTVVQGDAADVAAVRTTVHGADAVVVALGAPPADRSRLRTRGTLTAIEAMRVEGVDRIVALSVLGAGGSAARADWFTRTLVLDLWLRHVVADHDAQEAALAASGLAWTTVRPAHLTDGPRSEALHVGCDLDAPPPAMKVARADVAAVMLDCALSSAHAHAAIAVAG